MTYIAFDYDPQRDPNQFVLAVAMHLLMQPEELAVVDSKLRRVTDKAFANMTTDHLVAQLVAKKNKKSFELIKTNKEFKTDKTLISAFGGSYIGLVSGTPKKPVLQQILDIIDRYEAYEFLSNNTSASMFAKNYSALNLTTQEVFEYIAELEKGEQEKLAWVNARSKQTVDAFKALPQLIKRGF